MKSLFLAKKVYILIVVFILLKEFSNINNIGYIANFEKYFSGLNLVDFEIYDYLIIISFSITVPLLFFMNFVKLFPGDFQNHLIRYNSLTKWFHLNILKIGIDILLFYMVFLILPLFLFGFISNKPLNVSVIDYIFLHHYFINGFLQSINYFLLLFLFFFISNKVISLVIGIGLLVILGSPILNSDLLFPVALNSFILIKQNTNEIDITFRLLIYNFIEYIFILISFKNKKIRGVLYTWS